jgi:hypothetical protein
VPLLWLLLAFIPLAPVAVAAEGASVTYAGGTVSALKGGDDCRLDLTDDLFLTVRCRRREVQVAYTTINLVEYGQNVNRRLALAVAISPLFLLSKSRRHFVTVGYSDTQGKQQAMLFRVDKGTVRAVLVALEARTGLKVQYQDDEARKSGKG